MSAVTVTKPLCRQLHWLLRHPVECVVTVNITFTHSLARSLAHSPIHPPPIHSLTLPSLVSRPKWWWAKAIGRCHSQGKSSQPWILYSQRNVVIRFRHRWVFNHEFYRTMHGLFCYLVHPYLIKKVMQCWHDTWYHTLHDHVTWYHVPHDQVRVWVSATKEINHKHSRTCQVLLRIGSKTRDPKSTCGLLR